MSAEHKTVFISYRRNVAAFIARAIFLDLRANGYDVFMDVESIDNGTFDTIILNQIEARAHFLIILTPGTVERCAEPTDWLRREIEYALDNQRNIVPLIVNDFQFNDDTRKFLTGKLTELPRFNGLNIPHDFFQEAMERLRTRFLKQHVSTAIKPTPDDDRAIVQQKIEELITQPAPTTQEITSEEYFTRALARAKHDYDGKIADYSEAIRHNPHFAISYYDRGVARRAKGDLEGAIADYSEAIRLNSEYAKAYQNRGETYFVFEKFDNALEDFRQANNLRPAFNMTLGALAITRFVLGQKVEAYRLWRALLAQDESYRDAAWVAREFRWAEPLVEAARKLIADL